VLPFGFLGLNSDGLFEMTQPPPGGPFHPSDVFVVSGVLFFVFFLELEVRQFLIYDSGVMCFHERM